MAFAESLKAEIRRKAHLSCCLCKTIGIEIHHIVPQEEGGSDMIDNAAPLCPTCHETYGANPQKRKMLREARDVWFEICARRYASDADRLTQIHARIEELPAVMSSAVAESVIAKLCSTGVLKLSTSEDVLGHWSLSRVVAHLLSVRLAPKRKDKHVQFTFIALFETPASGETSPADAEYDQISALFQRTLGRVISEKVCIYLLNKSQIDFGRFTEDELGKVYREAFTTMVMLLSHEELYVFPDKILLRFDHEGMLVGSVNASSALQHETSTLR